MHFLPRLAVAAMLVAGIASVSFAKTPAKKSKTAKIDSTMLAIVRTADSLRRADSLHRVDSLAQADSTRRRIDSLRRVDSLARAERTWYVVRPNREAPDSAVAALLHERLRIALRRTGKVFVAGDADSATPSSWEAAWQAARDAGAGKVLMTALHRAKGRATVDAWVSPSSEVGRFDSLRIEENANLPPALWATDLVARLFPSAADSTCRADSSAQAGLRWALSPASTGSDTAELRRLARRLADGFRHSGRATWIDPPPAGDSTPVDSFLRASGVSRLLRLRLARDLDSAWVLDLRVANLAGDTAFDSLKVVDASLTGLVARAVPELLPAPRSCPDLCARPSTRAVWGVAVAADPSRKAPRDSVAKAIRAAFRLRADRQFLSLPDTLSGPRLDSIARARGVGRLVQAKLSGSDSSWLLAVKIRDVRTGKVDSGVLRRGGPARRVLPWMARHLAAWGAVAVDCDDACRLDSLREDARRWAVVGPVPTDTAPDSTARILAAAFPRPSRVQVLPGLAGCLQPACLDSLAAAQGIDRLVWIVRWRPTDTTWALQLRATDVVTDLGTDSVTLVGVAASPDSAARAARSVWKAFLHPRRCDSCLSRDTLEDALVLETPRFDGASDTVRAALREAMAKEVVHHGWYQLVEDRRPAHGRRSDLDSAGRRELVCTSGAAYRIWSQVKLEETGWRVVASLEEVATGKVLDTVNYLDKSKRPDRPAELVAWATRRLLKSDANAKAPDPKHDLKVARILKLGIPAAVGILSVVLHW